MVQRNGRLDLGARGQIGHNGLRGLTVAKYKDVVLVAEMDVRSQGSSPRPENYYVGVRLVRPDGEQIWFRESGGWPPKIVDRQGHVRSIEDIEVQLRSGDGKQVIAAVRSSSMGFYLLPLKNAPWDVYPVAGQIQLLLDGQTLGSPLPIQCNGLAGLYPDDVYDVVVQ